MKIKKPAPTPASNNTTLGLEAIDIAQLEDVSGGACPGGCGMSNCNMRMGGARLTFARR
jgi:hypothetical protein